MMTEIIYEAKCKDCKHLTRAYRIKRNGDVTKQVMHYCSNSKSKFHKFKLTLKSKACDNLEL